jgi:PadR family transcriptional regulator AphA
MEIDGLVKSHAEPQESRPDRKVYTITASGKTTMHEWLQEPVTRLETPKQLLLLKLFFSGNIQKEMILTQLRLLYNLHQHKINVYKTEASDFINQVSEENPEFKQDAIMWEATRRFGEKFENMYIEWLDETVQMIKEKF